MGCRYLQLDDTSLACLNDPNQRAALAERGDDAEHTHERNIRTINAAIADRPDGMRIAAHMCRGNFRSSWIAEGGYDYVAEEVFGGLDVDAFFCEFDDERSGRVRPAALRPARQAGRPRAGHHQARPPRGPRRAQAPHRRGREVRPARPALPLPAVRVLLDRRGQRAQPLPGGRQAAAGRRRRPRRLGRRLTAGRSQSGQAAHGQPEADDEHQERGQHRGRGGEPGVRRRSRSESSTRSNRSRSPSSSRPAAVSVTAMPSP